MQRITLLIVGRTKTSWISEGMQHFSERLRFNYDYRLVEVSPSKNIDPMKQRDEESKKILEHLHKLSDNKILLDEKGESITSVEFSELLNKAKDHGASLTFVLGGSYGVNDEVRSAVTHSLRLSDMTFPHEFCALIFLEQIYRAAEIQKGTGYHH